MFKLSINEIACTTLYTISKQCILFNVHKVMKCVSVVWLVGCTRRMGMRQLKVGNMAKRFITLWNELVEGKLQKRVDPMEDGWVGDERWTMGG